MTTMTQLLRDTATNFIEGHKDCIRSYINSPEQMTVNDIENCKYTLVEMKKICEFLTALNDGKTLNSDVLVELVEYCIDMDVDVVQG